jgi:hypothetical protein
MSIGVHFVKAYYKSLSTTPEQCFKFYKPHSYLSHGEGNSPSTAKGFEAYELADRWGSADLRFDFDGGAIDAQPSVNGSILLVATGHVVMKVNGEEERKEFIHTFFLACQELSNKRKTYYVHNDILRFLKEGQEPGSAEKSFEAESPVAKSENETKAVDNPAAIEEEISEHQSESPGGGVEETKEVASDEEPEEKEAVSDSDEKEDKPKKELAADASPNESQEKKGKPTTKETENAGKEGGSNSEGKKSRRQRERGKSPQQNAPKQQPASKPLPGSWASLVASGGGPTTVAPSTAASAPSKALASEKKETEKEAKPAETKSEKKAETSNAKENGKAGKDRPKRDPDNTLVIKNLSENIKEADLLAVFEKFAIQTKSKIVSSTISSHRGLAFVDYDSGAPVLAAVEQHGKEPIQLNGRVLEVDQKTAEQRARKARGGGYRSGSPNTFNRSGGSGRQNKRDRGNSGSRGGNKGNRSGGR